jgi:c-di-GMP-binding flagellar brake protein YcgR
MASAPTVRPPDARSAEPSWLGSRRQMHRPPPPPPIEHREHPRVDLFAQVQVTGEAEVHIMSARNISRGGIFLQGEPTEFPGLQPGVEVAIVIFVGEELGLAEVRLRARVVRVDERGKAAIPGFGLQFIVIERTQGKMLDQLIAAAHTR